MQSAVKWLVPSASVNEPLQGVARVVAGEEGVGKEEGAMYFCVFVFLCFCVFVFSLMSSFMSSCLY